MGMCCVRAEPVSPLGWYVKIKVSKNDLGRYHQNRAPREMQSATRFLSVSVRYYEFFWCIEQSQQERSKSMFEWARM